MITLENDILKTTVKQAGAELTRLYNKQTGIEYLWNGDPQFWGRHSPVLFPIVGGLKNDSYLYKGKTFRLSKHGFARDSEFAVEKASEDSATFILRDSPATLITYPFKFILKLHYSLSGNSVVVGYEIINPAREELLFSIGAHPAFAVPSLPDTSYGDYYLEFEHEETAGKWPIIGNLIGENEEPFLQVGNTINLKHELFYQDALVFKHLRSQKISLLNSRTQNGVSVSYPGFPYLGIWAAKDAPFVCIEPWCGIADSVNHNTELTEKEGIIKLAGNSTLRKEWTVRCF